MTVRRTSAQAGFALMAVSLAVLAIGVFLAAYLHWWQIELEKQRIETTRAHMASIHEAITRYSLQHRKLPCPGDPIPNTKAPTRFDDTGKQDEDCVPEDTAHHDQEVSPVWRGVVPLRALHLDVQTGLDGWGNQISYAVTRSLTAEGSLPPLRPPPGILRVDDQNMHNVLRHKDQGRYVIISHGPTGAGAWMPQGLRKPCVGGTLDSHNCNGESLFIGAAFTTTPGAGFYDDIVLTDDIKDRSVAENLAICSARHRFLSASGGDGDDDGCAERDGVWTGGCTISDGAGGMPVTAIGIAAAIMPPSIVTISPTAAGFHASGRFPPNLSPSDCSCGNDTTPFRVAAWDDPQVMPPYAPNGYFARNGACMVPSGKPGISATAKPGSWCLATVFNRKELDACTVK